jgi:TDG/mug DNA glycosylase family protein
LSTAALPPGGLPEQLLGDAPLRLVIVGHNPSATAWARRHYYANPSNWMWRILKETGLAPPEVRGADDDGLMPALAGVGFTDVGAGASGTDSSQFGAAHFAAWRQPFFDRMAAHAAHAGAGAGCTCGGCGAPAVVAFAGVRQFKELFRGGKAQAGGAAPAAGIRGDHQEVRLQASCPKSVALGRQWVLPQGWPLPPGSTEVWVVASTSGAAAMSRPARLAPWQELARRVGREAWPRGAARRCPRAARGLQGAVGGAEGG